MALTKVQSGLLDGGLNLSASAPANTLVTSSTGNVGVGTATPNANSGSSLVVYDVSTPRIRLTNNTTGQAVGDGAELSLFNSDFYIENRENANMIFYNNGAERMRIASGGNVGIGTTSPNARLEVVSTNIPLRVRATDSTVGSEVIMQSNLINANNATSSDYFFIGGIDGGSDRVYMLGNGNLQNINGSYGTISDANLKENIVDASPKLDKVMQLKVRNFNFIDDELKQIGFVAQELEQIFPGLIEESKNLDRDGKSTGTKRKAVKTTVLIPILVKAIQEQQAIITDLKARIETLEAK
jgi:hypothetical protein